MRLLADLRTVFQRHNTDRLATKALLADLVSLEEAPWGDLDGKGRQLDGRCLASELARYSVGPVAFKDDTNTTVKGYVTYPTKDQVGLADAWDRYLPAARQTPTRRGTRQHEARIAESRGILHGMEDRPFHLL
jgi:uncharacterized protein DUF3631